MKSSDVQAATIHTSTKQSIALNMEHPVLNATKFFTSLLFVLHPMTAGKKVNADG